VKKRHVVPISAYRLGPPPEDSAYFTPPVGQIGVHRPREIVRVERDYTGGEVVQFSSAYPTDLEGRVSIFTFVCFVLFLAKGKTPDHAKAVHGEYQRYQRDTHICL
jgi:hypothetical protein